MTDDFEAVSLPCACGVIVYVFQTYDDVRVQHGDNPEHSMMIKKQEFLTRPAETVGDWLAVLHFGGILGLRAEGKNT